MDEESQFTTVTELSEEEVFAMWYRCNECQRSEILDTFNFCPICGKRIDW